MGLHHAGFALVFALLVSGSVLPASSSLAAYSETRSFRDALEGRSMEEAISGPVDKDTSSYGDRTAQSSPSSMDAQNGQGGQMMLNIPANGNLNQQQPIEQTDQQKTSYTGPELEREAGPINGMQPMEQQMMMEQKAARMRSARPSMAERLMSMGPQRSARQQQTEQQAESYPAGKTTGEPSSFGDEQAGKQPYGGKQQPDSQQQSMTGAEGKQPAGEQRPMGYGAEDEQQQAGAGDQQQMMGMMNGADMGQQQQQQEKGYGGADGQQQQMLAKQRAMAAMLMSMNNGMKYSRNGQAQMMMNSAAGGQYGDKKQTSSMAQNMMMSLANKAAYMQRSQRQMAPPMMMMNGGSYSNGKPKAMMAGGNYKQQASPMSAMLMNSAGGSAMGVMRAMRRANQRRANEKKMSPAMVNAMLNKMVSMKQQQMDQSYGGSMKPATAMAMLMKSSAGAEMLANMMMPQMAGAMADMPAAKREQYKRMMMATLMQQQQTSEMADNEQQQQMTDSYAKPSMEKSSKPMNGYGAGGSTMSPMAMIMNMMNSEAGYDGQQQQQMADSYGSDRQPKKGPMSMAMPMAGKSDYAPGDSQQQMPEQQQQMEQQKSMDAGYGSGQGYQKEMMMSAGKGMMAMNGKGAYGAQSPPMMMSMRPSMPSALGNGKYGMEQAGDGMEQQKKMMSAYDMMDQQQKKMMNGYGSDMDQMQRQMPTTTESSYSADSKDSAMPMGSGKGGMSMRQAYMQQDMSAGSEKGYSSSAPMSPMAPMAPMGTKGGKDYSSSTAMPAKGYEQQMDQPQQQQESDYGSAPMGQAEPFAFDYKIEDDYGNGQYRKEESDKNGVVRGSYGYMDTSGIYRHVEYVADENGFRANIKSNEPGLSSETGASKTNGGSGAMDSQMAAGNYGQQQMMASPGNAMEAAGGNNEGKTNANSNSNNYNNMSGNTQQQMMSPAGQTQVSGDNADTKKKA